MRVLIITLYSGENEFDKCVESVKNQECNFIFEQVFVKNKTNQEAHNDLYSMIMHMSESYQYFVKLDADMILTSNKSLDKLINLAIQSKADIFSIPVNDYMTGKMIWGLNVYKSGVKWRLGTENIFTDQQALIGKNTITHENLSKESSLVSHASDPSDFQAFLFGVHRASKIVQSDSDIYKIGHAYGQYEVIRDVLKVYNDRKSFKHGLALIGASKMLRSELSRSDMVKKDFYFKDFKDIVFTEDIKSSMNLLHKPAWYILIKAAGLKKTIFGVSKYISKKYKDRFNFN